MKRSVCSERHQALASGPCNFGGLGLTAEVAEVDGFPIDTDCCSPHTAGFTPVHPSILRRRASGTSLVLGVWLPRLWENHEVAASAVKLDSVAVLAFKVIPRVQAEQQAMKKDGLLEAVSPIATAGVAARVKTPMPLVDEFSIGNINKDVISDAAVSGIDGDQNGILIGHRTYLRCQPSAGRTARGHFAASNCTRSLRVTVAA